MEIDLSMVGYCVGVVCACVGGIVSYFKGRKAKKASNNLTRKEQEEVLYAFMVDECKKVQKKSKYFQPSMTKVQVAEEKRDTVMEKITMYARGAGYTWYDEKVWEEKLTTLLSDAKALQN